MAVSTQVIRFTKEVTGVTNVTQDVALNFTPKAIIVFSDCATGDNAVAAHYQWSQGFSDGTTSNCITITSDDADVAADTQTVYAASVYARMSETSNATVLERATCSFITNGVRFTWAVASTTATRICMWAIGGDDITNVKVGNTQVNRTGTGTVDYTGLGFTPVDGESVLFTLGTFFGATSDTSATGASSHFGCAVSASKEWCIANVMENAVDPSDTWRVTYNNRTIINLGVTTGAEDWAAEFSTWITDGFRLNYTNGPEFSTYLFSYLVIKGGTWDAGTLTSPSTPTNNVDTAVSVSSRTLRGLLMNAAFNNTNINVIDTNAIISMGATDGTNQAVVANVDIDALGSMDSYRINNTTQIAKLIFTSGADIETVNFDSFTTNNFRLDWTVNSGATFHNWVVVADGPAAQQYPVSISETSVPISESLARVQVKLKPISETAVTVSETLTKIPTYVKTISDPSITVSETLVRVQSLIKTISETAVTVSETLARVPIYLKPVSETAITVSEQLTKGLVYTKPINESAISINDTIVRIPLYLKPISDETAITTNDIIARWISVSYTLAEPSISVNDSIQGALFYLRTISESAISVNDTIARILTAIRAISDPSISTNDTIVRIQTLLKTISESAISVNDSVAKVPTYVKSISETAINTNDSIVRILAAVRTIAEPSLSISDTITRIQTILKQISESAISVNDSVQAGLLLTISLVESRIKWYYSVLTRKIV